MRKYLIASLVVPALLATAASVSAETAIALRCVPVKEMSGKPVKALIAEHIKDVLTRRNWQNVSVTVANIRQGKSTDENNPGVASPTLTRGLTLLSNNDGTGTKSIHGRFGSQAQGALRCSTPIGRTKILVSGQFTTGTGEIVQVRRAPVDVRQLYVPGLLVPRLTKAS